MSRSSVMVPWSSIRDLSGATGEVVEVSFRGDRVRGIAELDSAVISARLAGPYPRPITDLLNLDLVLATETHPSMDAEPARLQVAVVPRQAPMAAIKRASQWAAWCTRVAVIPAGAILRERAALEAQVRGVWVLDSDGVVLVNGHHGCWPTSRRGFLHRLLAEVLWEVLGATHPASKAVQ